MLSNPPKRIYSPERKDLLSCANYLRFDNVLPYNNYICMVQKMTSFENKFGAEIEIQDQQSFVKSIVLNRKKYSSHYCLKVRNR